MKKIIRQIIKEDFDWVDNVDDLPLDDLINLVGDSNIKSKVENIKEKVSRFYERQPNVDWNDSEKLHTHDVQSVLHVKSILVNLENILDSLVFIEEDVNSIQNEDPLL